MDSHRVTAPDGTTLVVDEAGTTDGPAILFVHDLSHNRLVWRRQFDSGLADDFRLLAMDLRGHGDAGRPDEGYDDAIVWADDLKAVVEELDLTDVVIVAWGHGGIVVADYLEAHGTDGVAGLNLVGALSEVGTEAYVDATPTSVTDRLSGLASADVEESVAALTGLLQVSTTESLPPADLHFLLGCTVVVPPRVRDAMLSRTVARDDLWAGFEVPTLVTHGTSDDVVVMVAAKRHANVIPTARPAFYTDVGHMPFWESPDRFNADLRSFVDGLELPTRPQG